MNFEAQPGPAASGKPCPPLKEWTAAELDQAQAEVPVGSVADAMLDRYHLLRKQCS